MEVKVNGIVHHFKAKRNADAFCSNEIQFGGNPLCLVGGSWKPWNVNEFKD